MTIYREATINDIEKIAALHSRSWQKHYRGILRDEFLDKHVYTDRLEVWKGRLTNPQENQYILVAEDNSTLCGLACVFADYDPVWGALLDNLHVAPEYKGKGMGAKLLKSAANWAYTRNAQTKFYLWVYEENVPARKFYEKMGGINQELILTENPGGGHAQICRYVWTDLKQLIS